MPSEIIGKQAHRHKTPVAAAVAAPWSEVGTVDTVQKNTLWRNRVHQALDS